MDDRTAPASHVRHNLEGLTFAFSAGVSPCRFLIDGDGEPIGGRRGSVAADAEAAASAFSD